MGDFWKFINYHSYINSAISILFWQLWFYGANIVINNNAYFGIKSRKI